MLAVRRTGNRRTSKLCRMPSNHKGAFAQVPRRAQPMIRFEPKPVGDPMSTKKKFAKRTPKSQSEKAADKKSDALEKAGTAIIAGRNPKSPPPVTPAQAVEILREARQIDSTIRALDNQIESLREEFKEMKAEREKLVLKLRMEVRDSDQGRFTFEAPGSASAREGDIEDGGALDELENASKADDDIEPAADRHPRGGKKARADQ